MYSQRLKWAVIVPFLIALFLPLFSIIAPYIAFRLSLRELPREMSKHHVQDSITSVWHSSLISVCLLPLVAHVPFVCDSRATPADGHDISSLQRLIVAQRTFCDQLVHLAPPPHVVSSVAAIEEAVDLALKFDDTIMLLEEGQTVVIGIGDVRLLIAIAGASRTAFEAACNLLAHIELGLLCISFAQQSILSALSVMQHFDITGSFEHGSATPKFGAAIDVLAELTTSSVAHVQNEVASAVSSVLRALELLEKFETQGVTQLQCAKFAASEFDLCSRLAPLFYGTSTLRDLHARYLVLHDLLADGAEEFLYGEGQWGHSEATQYPIPIALELIKVHCEAVEKYAALVQSARGSVMVGADAGGQVD